MLSEELAGSQMEDSLNLELQEYRKKNQQLRRKLREKDSRIHYIDNASKQLASPEVSRIQPAYPPKIHHSQHRRKEKENRHYQPSDGSIFSQNRSVVEKHPADRQNVQLPALERSRNNIFQEDEANPQRKKVIKVAIERLKPLNTDEIRKRFLSRFQGEAHE